MADVEVAVVALAHTEGAAVAATNTTPNNSTPQSPVLTSKDKAYEGAYAAWLAEHHARRLHNNTAFGIVTSTLHDPKLPQVTLSHEAFIKEANKMPDVDTTVISPLFTSGIEHAHHTYHGCPSSLTDDVYFNHIKYNLRSISLRPSAKTEASLVAQTSNVGGLPVRTTTLTIEEALILSELLSDPQCGIEFLDFTSALDTMEEPQPQPTPERLAVVRKEIATVYSEEETEESKEKLQADVERLKGEYTNYNDGLTFLAKFKLDRVQIIVDALVKNKSLNEVRMAHNNFGAPDEIHHDGKSFFQPLNRLSRFIDLNKTVRILDLSDNHAGPQGVGIIAKAMCKNIGVHTLDLSGNDLMLDPPEEDDDPEYVEDDPVFGEMYHALEALSEMIKKNKFIRSLSLRNNYIKPDGVGEEVDDMGADTAIMKFFEPFKKYHRLEVLDLSSNELGDTGIRLLCSVLKDNQSIRHLDVSSNKIGPKGLDYLANLLYDSEYLDTFVAQQNDFAGKKMSKKSVKTALAAAQKFALALQKNNILTTLNLSGNHFGPVMCEILLITLSEAQELTNFLFDNNDMCADVAGGLIDDRALLHVKKALTKPESRIASLSLSGNNIREAGLQVLCTVDTNASADDINARYFSSSHFGALQGCVTINLSRNFINDNGFSIVCEHLRESVIINLDLSYNTITNAKPAAVLIRDSQLSKLNLSHNNIGGAPGCEQFAILMDAICSRGTVQNVDLSFNNLDDRHVPAIIALFHSNVAMLETVFIHGNPRININSALMILDALADNTTIRSFRMTVPANADDQAPLVKVIYNTLQRNTTLCDIDMGLQMSVAEEPEIREVQRLLLLNGLKLPRIKQES